MTNDQFNGQLGNDQLFVTVTRTAISPVDGGRPSSCRSTPTL
jgi:hypothetical protein